MAQNVGNKLTGNGERNDMKEKAPTAMYTDVQTIIHELVNRGEATQQTNKELFAMGQKFMGLGKKLEVKF